VGLCVCIPLSLLGRSSVKSFQRQPRIVGGVVFYTVRVVSKESRTLLLPTISCFIYVCALFYDALSISEYVASNNSVIREKKIGKDLVGSVRCIIEVLSRNLHAGAEENHENTKSE
jgi:hypothetical protein